MDLTPNLDRFASVHLRDWGTDPEQIWKTVEGTLCFVDISGFTALSEKLATLGRVGAEELTEILNRVFGDMLDLAARRGGSLVKYGGDALLLLFEGDDHAVQAASATVEMRSALRIAAEIPTSVGRVPLRMSQGVHTGPVHLFRADGSHVELIVGGAAASRVTEMEGIAEAGEIVVSDSTRALLPSGSASAAKGDGWLLRWRTPRVPPIESTGRDRSTGGEVDDLIPTALRPFLGAGTPDSEHRQATVAFVKAAGVDDLVVTTGIAATAAAIAEFVSAVMAIADEEEVTFLATDVDRNSFKIILVAGVPRTRVDEDGRMLRAARRIVDVSTPLQTRVGVNRGDVFAGEVGTSERSTYTIMGDTVNLAARLMAASPVGEVFATRPVIDGSSTLFSTAPVEPFHVKGKSAPVQAYAIGDESGTRDSLENRSPMVGRPVELARISEVLASSGTGVTVTGPTGIGKTRLVSEAVADLAVPRIDVRSEPYGSANPYRSWRDAIRTTLGVDRGPQPEMAEQIRLAISTVAPDLAPFAPLIGDVAHIELDPTPETLAIEPRFRHERTVDVVTRLLATVYPEGLVVFADDIHWADPATTSLLERIASDTSDLSERPWIVLATSREGVVEGTDELPLGPLEDDEVTELIHAATEAAPFRPDIVATIARRSGGSPLFVEELVTIVRESGDVSSLPTSLDGVVGSQIDNLPPLARRVLRYLSVLGRSFRVSVARDLLRSQEIDLDEATRTTLAAFIDGDGSSRLEFRHAMVRDMAYEGLSYRLRRELHAAAGTLLLASASGDEESVADMVALHFSEAGDHEAAWRYARMAADRNRALFANASAAAQYERALEAARRFAAVDEASRMKVWTDLGDVREQLGQFDAALDAYRRASEWARDDPEQQAAILLKRASAKERAGRYSAALSEATRARNLAESIDSPAMRKQRADAIGMEAVIRQAQQKPTEARKAALAAIEAAQSVDDDIALARALSVLDYSLVMLGDLTAATNSERSLEIYREHGRLDQEGQVAQNLGVMAYWRGDWVGALEFYREGRTALDRVGNVVEVARADSNIGEVLVNQGRFDEAEEPLFSARRVHAASGFDEGIAFVDILIGRMFGLRGELDQSSQYLESAIAASRGLRLDADILEASIHLADAACRSGDPAAGLRILDRATGEAPDEHLDFFAPLLARVRGSILDADGQHDEAMSVLKGGLAEASDRGDTYEAALLVATLDRIDSSAVLDGQRSEAQETFRTLGVRNVP